MAVVCSGPPPVQAQLADGAEEVAAAVAAARSRGCNGQPGARAALALQPALSQAAARLAQGTALVEAVRSTGYRAMRVTAVRMTGHAGPQTVVQTLAAKYCRQLVDEQFTEMGVHRLGSEYAVVLAAPWRPPAPAASAEVAARVLTLVNQTRASARQCGDRAFGPAPPLVSNALLDRAAALHAQDMARRGVMTHEGSDGSSFADRIRRAGYVYRTAGENVAAGQPTPERLVSDWAKSPPHCANLMNRDFTEMGLAFALNTAADSGIFWAQEFGRPR